MIISPTGNIKQIQTNCFNSENQSFLKFRKICLGGRFSVLINLIDLDCNKNEIEFKNKYDEISSHNYLQLNSQPQPVQLIIPVISLSFQFLI